MAMTAYRRTTELRKTRAECKQIVNRCSPSPFKTVLGHWLRRCDANDQLHDDLPLGMATTCQPQPGATSSPVIQVGQKAGRKYGLLVRSSFRGQLPPTRPLVN